MDYLSGKLNSSNNEGSVDVRSKSSRKHESNFVKLSKAMLACLSSDEQATISEKYLTPVQGVVQYPVLPNVASEADFGDNRQNKWKGEQVNAGNSGKVAKKIVIKF